MPGFGPVLAGEFLGATGGDLTVFQTADRFASVAGLSALKSCPASRGYYDRKRTEGKTHIRARHSLAQRRLNVLWARLRDGTTYIPGRLRHRVSEMGSFRARIRLFVGFHGKTARCGRTSIRFDASVRCAGLCDFGRLLLPDTGRNRLMRSSSLGQRCRSCWTRCRS
jgi:hypothetical protein